MDLERNNSGSFLNQQFSKCWLLENFIIIFSETGKRSGTFSISYFSTGRQFTGHYFLTKQHCSLPLEIILMSLKEKFWIIEPGEIKGENFLSSNVFNLPNTLNSVIDIY